MNAKTLRTRLKPHLWYQAYWVVYLIWFFWLDLTITDPKYILSLIHIYSYHPAPDLAPLPKVEPETFMGFRRKDGRAAIRNEIWIIPTVGCVNDIAKKMVNDNQDLEMCIRDR